MQIHSKTGCTVPFQSIRHTPVTVTQRLILTLWQITIIGKSFLIYFLFWTILDQSNSLWPVTSTKFRHDTGWPWCVTVELIEMVQYFEYFDAFLLQRSDKNIQGCSGIKFYHNLLHFAFTMPKSKARRANRPSSDGGYVMLSRGSGSKNEHPRIYYRREG
jgi:hypothetical protein